MEKEQDLRGCGLTVAAATCTYAGRPHDAVALVATAGTTVMK